MANPLGEFHPEIVPAGWFDETAEAGGWFDRDNISSASGGAGTDALTATGVATGAPSVGSPAVGQVHALTATGVAAGAPSVGAPELSENNSGDLTAESISTGVPSVGSPDLGQVHFLEAVSVSTGTPTVGAPGNGLEQVSAPGGSALFKRPKRQKLSWPVVTTPRVVVAFSAVSISTATPKVGSPALEETFDANAMDEDLIMMFAA